MPLRKRGHLLFYVCGHDVANLEVLKHKAPSSELDEALCLYLARANTIKVTYGLTGVYRACAFYAFAFLSSG